MNGILFLILLVEIIGCGQAGLRGAWFDVSPTAEDVQQVAEWALTQMESGYTLKEIKGAQKQIISGFPLKRNSSVERLAQLLFSKYTFEMANGINYRIEILFKKDNGFETTCVVRVHVALDGTKSMLQPYPCTRG